MQSDKKPFDPSRLRRDLSAAVQAADLPVGDIARTAGIAACTAVIASASLFSIAHPFGIAVIAAAGDGVTATAAALGTVLGSLALPGFPGVSIASVLLLAARLFVASLLTGGPSAQNAVDIPVRRGPHGGRGQGRGLHSGRVVQIFRAAARTDARPILYALAAAAAMLSGAVSLLWDGGTVTVPSLLSVFFSAVVTPLCTAAIAPLLRRGEKAPAGREGIGVLLLAFAAARALRDMGLPFRAGVLFAFSAPLLFCYCRRGDFFSKTRTDALPLSLAMGVVCGLAIAPAQAAVFGIAVLAAAFLMGISPAAAVCASWLSALAVSWSVGGVTALAGTMPEITVAAAILLPLLRFSVVRRAASRPVLDTGEAAEAARIQRARADAAVLRVERLSDACGDLSDVFGALSRRLSRPGVIEVKEICDRAAANYCQSCDNRTLCWEREYATTADTVCRITAALHKDGRVTAAVIPKNLAARCHHMDDLLTEVNETCARRTAEAAASDKTDVLGDDLSSFSEILSEAAAGVRSDFERDGEMSRRLTRAAAHLLPGAPEVTVYGTRRRMITARSPALAQLSVGSEDLRAAFETESGLALGAPQYGLDGTAVTVTMESRQLLSVSFGACTRAAGEGDSPSKKARNGDAAARLTTEDGRFIAMITDGMGTGGEASVTARLSVTFLTKILSARVSMEAALKMLNRYLRARRMECSVGIDVMEIDLYTAEARCLKSGAAPSFVVREGRLFRLMSKTVPIGILRALDAEMIRFTLQPGDTVVMLSDGVLSGFEEAAWLCDLLVSPSVLAETPEQIAKRIVAAAAAAESRDDITAAVVRVKASASADANEVFPAGV